MIVYAQQTGLARSDFLARYVRGSEPVLPMPACDIEPHAANPAWSKYRFPCATKFSDAELCDLAFTGGAAWCDAVWAMRPNDPERAASIGHDCTSFALPRELAPYAPWGPDIEHYCDQHRTQTWFNGPLCNALWSMALIARDTGRYPHHLHGQYEPGVFAGGLPADDPRWRIAESLCLAPPRYFHTICKWAEGYARLRAIDMPATIAFNDYIRDWESRGVANAIKASGLPADVTWSKEYSQRVPKTAGQIGSPWPTHFAPGQTVPDGRTSHLYWVEDTPAWRETFARLLRVVPIPITFHLNLSVSSGVACPLDWILPMIVQHVKKVARVILFAPPPLGAKAEHEAQYQTVLSALVKE